MRFFKKLNFLRCRPISIIYISLSVLILISIYFALGFLPYLYQVSHGEMPCFVNESHRAKIRHMLFSFHELMSLENLTYWIDYGTLLGSVRRGAFIPYDHDADAVYLLKDIRKVGSLVAPALMKKYGIEMDEWRPIQLNYQGTAVDLFAMAKYEDIGLPLPNGANERTLTRAFFRVSQKFEETYSDLNMDIVLPTRPCQFEGKLLMCPKNPHAVLAKHYPYTYWLNIRIPFKLKCYLNPFSLFRVLIYGE